VAEGQRFQYLCPLQGKCVVCYFINPLAVVFLAGISTVMYEGLTNIYWLINYYEKEFFIMDKIYEKREKEQEKLKVLKKKREVLDGRIKDSESKIEQYTMMINQKKFSEVTDVISSTGLSLEEVMAAIKKGDLLSLQEKIEDKDSKSNENEDGNTQNQDDYTNNGIE
jgi:hypothetical protein